MTGPRRRPWPRRRGESAQAALETGLVLPILLLMLFGFISLMIEVQTQQELDTATKLAVDSAFQAPRAQAGCAASGGGGAYVACKPRRFAAESFTGTMSFSDRWLTDWNPSRPSTLPAADAPAWTPGTHVVCFGRYFGDLAAPLGAAGQPAPQQQAVECTVTVRLRISRSPMGWAWLPGADPVLSSTAVAFPPPFRAAG